MNLGAADLLLKLKFQYEVQRGGALQGGIEIVITIFGCFGVFINMYGDFLCAAHLLGCCHTNCP